jgi:hypothetical protein
MSSNRLTYDECAYKKTIEQSTGPLNYNLYPGKYENCSKCRMEFGVVGGNGVSLFSGNLVDLESDLRGQTRLSSKCPSNVYTPSSKNPSCNNGSNGIPYSSPDCQVKLKHQPSCQMQYFPRVPMPAKFEAPKGCDWKK